MRDLTLVTQILLARGWRVFQGALLAQDEATHVHALLGIMDPPRGAKILDMGCGIGAVAELMAHERPDLDFLLVNQDRNQLRYAPPTMAKLWGDFHKLPLSDGCADGAMFCYSLCHANIPDALEEVARLVATGGFLFVYDYERMSGNNAMMQSLLDAQALPRDLLEALLEETGWELLWWLNPRTHDARFRGLWDDDAGYDAVFDHLRVCAWKARRR